MTHFILRCDKCRDRKNELSAMRGDVTRYLRTFIENVCISQHHSRKSKREVSCFTLALTLAMIAKTRLKLIECAALSLHVAAQFAKNTDIRKRPRRGIMGDRRVWRPRCH